MYGSSELHPATAGNVKSTILMQDSLRLSTKKQEDVKKNNSRQVYKPCKVDGV